jgi:hypothetical protein
MIMSLPYIYYLFKSTLYMKTMIQSLNNKHITLLFHASIVAHIMNNE